MKENKIFKIVFSSTAAVYGNIDIDVIDESTTTNPINPYGLSKYFSEKAIETYYQSAGFSGICLRYFNASGASSELEIGEDHNPEFHLIPKLISSVRGSKEKLKVFGRDYPTKDGTCIRDYIHVEDLARAHVLSLKKLFNSEKTIYENINLGSGSGFSILEIIKNFEKLTGEKVSWEYSEKRTGDPAKLVADISKAKKTLNWTPEKSNLENILTTAFNWHKKRFKD